MKTRRVFDVKKMHSVIGCAKRALKGKSVKAWLDESARLVNRRNPRR